MDSTPELEFQVEKKHITDLCWIVGMDLCLELLGQIHCGICISIRDIICYRHSAPLLFCFALILFGFVGIRAHVGYSGNFEMTEYKLYTEMYIKLQV